MAYADHTELRTPREADISTKLNDRRSAIAARGMRRAMARVSPKRAYLEINAAIEPEAVA